MVVHWAIWLHAWRCVTYFLNDPYNVKRRVVRPANDKKHLADARKYSWCWWTSRHTHTHLDSFPWIKLKSYPYYWALHFRNLAYARRRVFQISKRKFHTPRYIFYHKILYTVQISRKDFVLRILCYVIFLLVLTISIHTSPKVQNNRKWKLRSRLQTIAYFKR